MMTIGIVGSGAMGSGIAQVAATAGHETIVFDSNPSILEKASANLLDILNKLASKGKMDDRTAKAIFGRVYFVDNLEAFSACDLIIEAIVENLDTKQALFRQLENVVKDSCMLATNTSSLSVSAIAAACRQPSRVIGIHFFNPPALMKLVEIIPAIQTNSDSVQLAKSIIESWEKTVVMAKDTPGFIVNRIARPFYGEAIRILEEGMADVATIDWAMTEIGGFRMGPFALMDFIGNDINYTVTETVFRAFYFDPRYKPSFTQKRLAEAGWLGRKSGKGYYDYSENASQPIPKKDHQLGEYIVWRIVVMLINEAAEAHYLNIASRDDIDTAMTTGVNYPKGLLRWADELGIQNCVEMMDRLYGEYLEDRYRCSVLLRKMAKEKKTFY